MVQFAVDKFGRLDILVNNAGADAPHMIWNMTEQEWDLSVDSYLKGTFNTSRFAAALMREQKWGRIINTTSTAWLGTVGHCNYGAAKAGDRRPDQIGRPGGRALRCHLQCLCPDRGDPLQRQPGNPGRLQEAVRVRPDDQGEVSRS